jgi:anti-sigma factor RsiW
VVEVRHPVEVPGSEATHLGQWLSRRIGYSLRAPDLDGAELKLVGGRLLPSSAGPGAAFFMYEGTTGERFTLYCRKIVNAPESSLRYRTMNMIGSFAWIEDNVAFVVSGPPDRVRLQKIAEAVQQQIEAPPASRLSDARGTRR